MDVFIQEHLHNRNVSYYQVPGGPSAYEDATYFCEPVFIKTDPCEKTETTSSNK